MVVECMLIVSVPLPRMIVLQLRSAEGLRAAARMKIRGDSEYEVPPVYYSD